MPSRRYWFSRERRRLNAIFLAGFCAESISEFRWARGGGPDFPVFRLKRSLRVVTAGAENSRIER